MFSVEYHKKNSPGVELSPHDGKITLRFRIIGDLKVEYDNCDIPLGSHKQRLALMVLLTARNRPVSVRRIVEALWPENPPAAAKKNLQVYVSNLRNTFNATGNFGRILHESGSYRIIVHDEEIDIYHLEQAIQTGRAAISIGEYAEAARSFRAAMNLWESPPTPANEFPDGLLAEHANWLYEQYMRLMENWANAEIEGGDCAAVAEEISRFIEKAFLREGLFTTYLKALFLCGRRTEALTAYGEMRNILAKDLGISPSTSLQHLHREILAGQLTGWQDDEFEADAPPSLIPRDLHDFIGLSETVREAKRNIAEKNDPILLWGLAGVGKTSLAVNIAHQLRDEFPDGRIFVRVRSEDGKSRTTMSILRELAHGIGRPTGFPHEKEAALAVWQRWLSGRQVLVIFDDVTPDQDIRDLLPRSETSVAVLTARRRMTYGGTEIKVPVPDEGEILQILCSTIRTRRHIVGDHVLVAIAKSTPPLRLAARIVGMKLAMIPEAALSKYTKFLETHDLRLDDFTSAGLSLRGRLANQWQDLTEAEQRGLVRLSRDLPHKFNNQDAAISLQKENATMSVLTGLIEAECLWVMGNDSESSEIRYEIPDFLREYAKEIGRY